MNKWNSNPNENIENIENIENVKYNEDLFVLSKMNGLFKVFKSESIY